MILRKLFHHKNYIICANLNQAASSNLKYKQLRQVRNTNQVVCKHILMFNLNIFRFGTVKREFDIGNLGKSSPGPATYEAIESLRQLH